MPPIAFRPMSVVLALAVVVLLTALAPSPTSAIKCYQKVKHDDPLEKGDNDECKDGMTWCSKGKGSLLGMDYEQHMCAAEGKIKTGGCEKDECVEQDGNTKCCCKTDYCNGAVTVHSTLVSAVAAVCLAAVGVLGHAH